MKFREIQEPHKGRAAIAATRLQPGTQLLSTDAYVAVSLVACNRCFKTTSLQRCSGCRLIRYCSRQCQRDDWTRGAHDRECAAWKHIPQERASQTVLLVSRLAAKVLLSDASDRHTVLQLRHHAEDHTPEKLKEFTEMAHLVVLILSRSKWNTASRSFDALVESYEQTIVELFCRVNCNAFTICDDVNVPVGIGMFPQAALLNHSCEPNCVVTFSSPQKLKIQVITPVEPGDELTISYVELFESTTKRREALRASYFFQCACSRCRHAEQQQTEEDWLLDGFVCRNNSCGDGVFTVKRARCRICSHDHDINLVQEDLATLDALQKSLAQVASIPDRWELHQRIWRLVDQQLKCHPQSTRYANTCRAIGNFLIDHGEQLDVQCGQAASSALSFLQKERDAIAWVLPTHSLPSRGLLHFQLAKLSLAAGLQEDAERYIRDALAVLSVTYGSDHSMVLSAQAFLLDLSTSTSIHES